MSGLNITDPVKQIAFLNKWADGVESKFADLQAQLHASKAVQLAHKKVFEKLFTNPHDLQAALAGAGVSVQGNVVGTSTVTTAGGLPLFTSVTTAPTAVTATVSWTWPDTTIYWPDGTQHVVKNSTAQYGGPFLTTGLNSATDYWFYPYWDYQTNKFNWVIGCNGVGSTKAAQTVASMAALAIQQTNGHLALSNGGLKATTPAVGGGGGGGAGGGDAGCHPPDVQVKLKSGPARIADVSENDELACPEGWTRVVRKLVVPHEDFIRVVLHTGHIYECASNHTVITLGGEKLASELTLDDMLHTVHNGTGLVRGLERFEIPNGRKVIIKCEPFDHFYVNDILAHNTNKPALS